MRRPRLTLGVSTVALGGLVASLLVVGGSTTPVRAAGLEPARDCDDLLGWLRATALPHVTAYGWDTGDHLWMFEEGFASRGPAIAADLAAQAAPPVPAVPGVDFSETNVQEVGVDEPDLVDTNGRVLVAVARGAIRVVDVTGSTPVLRATIPLGSDGPGAGLGDDVPWFGEGQHEVMLAGDRLLVVSRSFDVLPTDWLPGDPAGPPGAPGGPFSVAPGAAAEAGGAAASQAALFPVLPAVGTTVLTLFDVSDPAHPRQVATTRIDGELVGARMVEGVARLVVRRPPRVPMVGPQGPGAEQRALDSNRQAVRTAPLAAWLPSYTHRAGGVEQSGVAVDCSRVFRPTERDAGLSTVTVLTFAVADEDLVPEDSIAVVADAATVYASRDRVYVATSRWPTGPVPLPAVVDPLVMDEPMGAPGGTADADTAAVPPPLELPTETRTLPVEPPPDQPATDIHAFEVTGGLAYLGSIRIPGVIHDQWALSEHRGYLRVVVTTGQPWDRSSQTHVVVVDTQGGELVRVGEVGGLGPGEQVYAVRFLGDVGYVVTFRQTDPLYVVDLRDPTAPRVTGELEMLGYSAYLHPVGDGMLLGVGQDATPEGRTLGTLVALFDVSDPTQPRRVAELTLAGSGSQVEFDHRAFLYWPPTGLAVVPVQAWGPVPALESRPTLPPDVPFLGALAVQVDPAGPRLELRRELTQQDHLPAAQAWEAQIDRTVVVGGTLYTVSQAGLEAVRLDDLTELAWLPWS